VTRSTNSEVREKEEEKKEKKKEGSCMGPIEESQAETDGLPHDDEAYGYGGGLMGRRRSLVTDLRYSPKPKGKETEEKKNKKKKERREGKKRIEAREKPMAGNPVDPR
jgi:hypothetical protein